MSMILRTALIHFGAHREPKMAEVRLSQSMHALAPRSNDVPTRHFFRDHAGFPLALEQIHELRGVGDRLVAEAVV